MERISFTFDPRDMLLSLQMGFSFVRAAVAYGLLSENSLSKAIASEHNNIAETFFYNM